MLIPLRKDRDRQFLAVTVLTVKCQARSRHSQLRHTTKLSLLKKALTAHDPKVSGNRKEKLWQHSAKRR